MNSVIVKEIGFKPHPEFKKIDVESRIELIKSICENIWSAEYFQKTK